MDEKDVLYLDSLGLGDLAIFCGAGISKNSGLPLANELKQSIIEKLSIDKKDMDEIMNSDLPFEAFMEIISENTDILRILGIFENGEPNTNHILIARLAKNGYLKTIFTTNFDLLIEKALEKEGLKMNKDYTVYYDEEQYSRIDFENMEDGKVRVFKIHGSVDNKGSLRTTMKAVANKTISDKRMKVIRYLFSTGRHKKVLILGYSCSDEFDITPQIQSIEKNKNKIIFIEHCEEGEEIEDIRIKGHKNPFKRFPGKRIRCNTDDFIRDLWNSLKGTVGEYKAIKSELDWKTFVYDWADEELQEEYLTYLIAGLILHEISNFRRGHDYLYKASYEAFKTAKVIDTELELKCDIDYDSLGDSTKRAIMYYEKIFGIIMEEVLQPVASRYYPYLGDIYYSSGDSKKAIEYYLGAEKILIYPEFIFNRENLALLRKVCKRLAITYEKIGDNKNAKEYKKRQRIVEKAQVRLEKQTL